MDRRRIGARYEARPGADLAKPSPIGYKADYILPRNATEMAASLDLHAEIKRAQVRRQICVLLTIPFAALVYFSPIYWIKVVGLVLVLLFSISAFVYRQREVVLQRERLY